VERHFETLLSPLGEVDFMGQVSHFLGIEFTWHYFPHGHLSVTLTQQSFTENLLESLGYFSTNTSTFTSPHRSGMSIDSIPSPTMSTTDQDNLRLKYQSLVGSLNWLSHTTRPDLSTVVSLLAQHQSHLLKVIWMLHIMWLSIYLILDIWEFILAVYGNINWNLFYIFQLLPSWSPCRVQIGVLMTLHDPLLQLSYRFLPPAPCLHSTLTL
jgi:hypothetical protein